MPSLATKRPIGSPGSHFSPILSFMVTSLEAAPHWEDLSDNLFNIKCDQIRNSHSLKEIAALGTPFVRCESDQWTPLHSFCHDGCYGKSCPDDELLKLLMDLGIPIDARASNGSTALHSAAASGWIPPCKLLLRGADTQVKNSSGETPLHVAINSREHGLVAWLLEQQSRITWDSILFKALMKHTPKLASTYLDKFAVERGSFVQRDSLGFEFFDLRHIYGLPHETIDSTALAIAVIYAKIKNVLNHKVMVHITYTKFGALYFILLKETAAYLGLLTSYYATIVFADTDWINLTSSSDYAVMVLRAFAWLCCLYLIIVVEFREFCGGNYFKSFWNWLNMIMYGAILASIPLELIGGSTSSARNNVIALISVSLWFNALPYLSMHRKSGLLIASMGRMVQDVGQFVVLYSVFLFGFSGAFHET